MADLTPEGLERIEGLAKAATPGPWLAETDHPPDCCVRSVNTDSIICEIAHWSEKVDIADTNFIAAANPETILALVARVRELERGQLSRKFVAS